MMRYLTILLLMLGSALSANAASEPTKLEIGVSPEMSQYGFLMQAPSYAALAMQNAGLNLSMTKPLVITDRTTFEIGPGRIKYLDRKGAAYRYAVTLTLPLGKEIRFPVEIDSAALAHGRLVVNLQSPLAGLVPREFMEKVESKLQTLGNANAQRQLMDYLKKAGGPGAGEAHQAELLDRIAFDAYVQAGLSTTKDVGNGEPLSDQLVLLATVFIWMICAPLFLFAVRRHRARSFEAGQHG